MELETTYPYTAKDGTCKYKESKATDVLTSSMTFVTKDNPSDMKNAVAQ